MFINCDIISSLQSVLLLLPCFFVIEFETIVHVIIQTVCLLFFYSNTFSLYVIVVTWYWVILLLYEMLE